VRFLVPETGLRDGVSPGQQKIGGGDHSHEYGTLPHGEREKSEKRRVFLAKPLARHLTDRIKEKREIASVSGRYKAGLGFSSTMDSAMTF
jgi:hypothetical protein